MATPTGQTWNPASQSWNITAPPFRIPRPGYEWVSTTSVKIAASSTKIRYFLIAGNVYTVTSDLTCALSSSGYGGMWDDAALAANTPYYLYVVLNGSTPSLIASPNDPDDGPSGIDEWTYIGAVATDEGAATVTAFQASGGVLMAWDEIESETHTGNTTSTAQTFASIPATATKVYGIASISPTDLGQSARVSPISSTTAYGIIQVTSHASHSNWITGWLPVFTANTLYLRVSAAAATVAFRLLGWQEDPTEYP